MIDNFAASTVSVFSRIFFYSVERLSSSINTLLDKVSQLVFPRFPMQLIKLSDRQIMNFRSLLKQDDGRIWDPGKGFLQFSPVILMKLGGKSL